MIAALAMAAALLAYNTLLNRSRLASGPLYVPINLGTALLAVLVGGWAGLDAQALGLGRPDEPALTIGLVLAAVMAVTVGPLLPGTRPLYWDRRVADLDGREVAYQAAIRVPLGTALAEEVLFRGVLLGLFLAVWDPWPAILASSVAFGLWHVEPSREALRINRVGEAARYVALAVGATSAAGVGLCGLRLLTDAIWAPFLLHVAVNSGGLVAAFLVQRAQTSSSPH
ncbi:MAG: CPBP family intramembrane metalloprotease [Actinomycetota bacterium]|nr:CPBP family intramembrane metalloprotease [Actinomycetota bacterium]